MNYLVRSGKTNPLNMFQVLDDVHEYDSFIACCKENIWETLRPKIKCKIIGFENLMHNKSELVSLYFTIIFDGICF